VKVLDVMTNEVVTVTPETGLKEAARAMIGAGVSGLPVVDDGGRVVGIITEADFLEAEAERSWGRERRRLLDVLFGDRRPRNATVVGEAMSREPICIDPDSRVAEAARLMAERRVKRLPVVGPDGRLRGIISRADIVAAFARSDEVIADEIVFDVIRRILMLEPDALEVTVDDGTVVLRGEVPKRSDARMLVELVGRLEGVTTVDDSGLSWTYDDSKNPEDPAAWH